MLHEFHGRKCRYCGVDIAVSGYSETCPSRFDAPAPTPIKPPPTLPVKSRNQPVFFKTERVRHEETEEGRDSLPKAFCVNCRRDRPYRYAQQSTPRAAITYNLGGPIDPTLIYSSTESITVCSVCGGRVYTKEELAKSESQGEIAKIIVIFCLMGIIACFLFLYFGWLSE